MTVYLDFVTSYQLNARTTQPCLHRLLMCHTLLCLRTVCSEIEWQKMLDYVKSNAVELRDNRYDQVVHMVTAASGAETFYQLENNATRSEGFELARDRDAKAAEVKISLYTFHNNLSEHCENIRAYVISNAAKLVN